MPAFGNPYLHAAPLNSDLLVNARALRAGQQIVASSGDVGVGVGASAGAGGASGSSSSSSSSASAASSSSSASASVSSGTGSSGSGTGSSILAGRELVIMVTGDPTGHVGNAALGTGARSAFDERLARLAPLFPFLFSFVTNRAAYTALHRLL